MMLKPFQSYIFELFEYRVDSIIKEISNYFDNSPTPFGGFVRKILVNGQEPLKIFINGRDQQFILEKINGQKPFLAYVSILWKIMIIISLFIGSVILL